MPLSDLAENPNVSPTCYGYEVPPPPASAVAAAIKLSANEINEAEIAGRTRRRLPNRILGAPSTHPSCLADERGRRSGHAEPDAMIRGPLCQLLLNIAM